MTAVACGLAVVALSVPVFSGRLSGIDADGLWRRATGDVEALSTASRPAFVPGAESQSPARSTVLLDHSTPVFASVGDVELALPVPADSATEVAFHQAARSYAMHMETPLPDADPEACAGKRGTGRAALSEPEADGLLTGSVIRMWRSRPGLPDSAADVGAAPGTPVASPVNGEVVLVRSYKLYGEHDDAEIHIRPDGLPDGDLVMIHVANVAVEVGDRTVRGRTVIGEVRRLSDRLNHQLADYTADGGDHVHFQINNAADPEYKGLDEVRAGS